MEMNLTQSLEFFRKQNIDISRTALLKWAKSGLLDAWQDTSKRWYFDSETVLKAIATKKVPPKIGRARKYTNQQKEEMKRLKERGFSLSQIAKMFGCDQSYVSLVYRNLR